MAVCSAPNTDAAVALSSSPVGSSASSTDGELASATAIATRCCSPPDIWSGRRPAQCATPSRPSSSPVAGPPGAAARAGEPERQVDVLQRGQVRQQVARGLLPDEPDHRPPVAEPLPPRHRRQVAPGHPHGARGGRVEPGQDVHQRGLAAAGRADQRGQLPGPTTRSRPCSACTSMPSAV